MEEDMRRYPSSLWSTDHPAWVIAVAKVRDALLAGRPATAEIGECNSVPVGTIVPVVLAGPKDLYGPLHIDGTPAEPDRVPGYRLEGGAWGQVAWSGGGFFNPHTIILEE